MKKYIAIILAFIGFFALMLEFTKTDPNYEFSFRGYIENVTENIEPFPTANLKLKWEDGDGVFERIGGFFVFLGELISFPLKLVGCFIKNALVLFGSFFPITWDDFTPPVFDGVDPSTQSSVGG